MKNLLLISIMGFSFIPNSFGQELFEVLGAITINHISSSNPPPGTIRFNQGTRDFEGWNGHFWTSLSGRISLYGVGVTDVDGNSYPSVIIGDQEWMAENLRTSKYRDSTAISFYGGSAWWSTTNSGAWCWYDNDNNFDLHFGKLYNGFAVDDSRGLCPAGWHVPSEADWEILKAYLGEYAGGKMKEPLNYYHWRYPNTGASNESGFTGVGSGFRDPMGEFSNILNGGYWWSTSPGSGASREYYLFYSNRILHMDQQNLKRTGMSIRCVKD